MIPEREREALMRLTMCAREECSMCKYEEQCDNWDFRMELATKNMNILADALRKTEPQYDFGEYADRLWKIAYERGKREALAKDEPQTCSVNGRPYDCGNCEYHKCMADEPQTDCGWR